MQRVCTKGARNRFPSMAWRVVASVCVLLINHLKPCPVERCDNVSFRCLACAVQHVQGDLAYLGTAFIDMCLKHDLCRLGAFLQYAGENLAVLGVGRVNARWLGEI